MGQISTKLMFLTKNNIKRYQAFGAIHSYVDELVQLSISFDSSLIIGVHV